MAEVGGSIPSRAYQCCAIGTRANANFAIASSRGRLLWGLNAAREIAAIRFKGVRAAAFRTPGVAVCAPWTADLATRWRIDYCAVVCADPSGVSSH